MLRYLVGYFDPTITQIDVIRETEKCYFVQGAGRGVRALKDGRYHETREMAHAFLLEREEVAVAAAKIQLGRAETRLAKAKKLGA